jgi:hypothetical protein
MGVRTVGPISGGPISGQTRNQHFFDDWRQFVENT